MPHILVPRPVADALMPRECPVGAGPRCPLCDGSGFLPSTLQWVVVEGVPVTYPAALACACKRRGGVHPWEPGEWCSPQIVDPPPAPPADLVRAVESGDRIDIAVECDVPNCFDGAIVVPGRQGDGELLGPCTCTAGRVVVGSVLPTEILAIAQEPPDGPRRDAITIGPDYSAWHFNRPIDLAPYGDPASLVGRYAIRVTDPQKADR